MKNTIKTIAAVVALGSMFACAPIEDQSLREKYVTNAGAPLTSAEITQHLSVTQPKAAQYEDFYIEVKNNDPDIAGVWHFTTGGGDAVLYSKNGSYEYSANGDFEVFFVATTGNQLVESEHFKVSVANVFDPWVGMLTGATSSKDVDSQKTWEFRTIDHTTNKDTAIPHDPTGWICESPGYPLWAYYPCTDCGQDWGGKATFADAGDQTMVFKFGGNKLTTYDKNGNKKAEGSFGVSRTAPDPRDPAAGTGMKAMGALTTNIPLPGGEYDWDGQGDNNTFLLLELTDEILSVGHANWPNPVPAKWTDDDWGVQIWLCWYKVRK